MTTYICRNCKRVFMSGSSRAKCCGDLEEFSSEKHGELLIGSSNSWINVWEEWKDNPLMDKVSEKLYEEGCYGAWSHLNAFIKKLIDYYEDNIE